MTQGNRFELVLSDGYMAQLDILKKAGGFSSRAELIRALISFEYALLLTSSGESICQT